MFEAPKSVDFALENASCGAAPLFVGFMFPSHPWSLALVMASTCGWPPTSRQTSHDSVLKPTSATAFSRRFAQAYNPPFTQTRRLSRRSSQGGERSPGAWITTETITDRPYYSATGTRSTKANKRRAKAETTALSRALLMHVSLTDRPRLLGVALHTPAAEVREGKSGACGD
ncbi:hypothetical protein LTR54_004250, partial [Friedmanniomyces endolithicus]